MFTATGKKYIFLLIFVLCIAGTTYLYSYWHRNIYTPEVLSLSTNGLGKFGLLATALNMYPPEGVFNVGDTVNLLLLVNTTDQAINAVEGTIVFPPDKLEVVNVSYTGSIITLWAEKPTFSNPSGTISFSGALPSPGFIGLSGQILFMQFKVKNYGYATIEIQDAQVLANDGNATNILTDTTQTKLTILKPKIRSADVDGDGKVNLKDASILVANWGKKNDKLDLNGDGTVNLIDLSILLSGWTQ